MFFCVFCSNESLIRYLAIPRTSGKLHFKRQRELTLAKKKRSRHCRIRRCRPRSPAFPLLPPCVCPCGAFPVPFCIPVYRLVVDPVPSNPRNPQAETGETASGSPHPDWLPLLRRHQTVMIRCMENGQYFFQYTGSITKKRGRVSIFLWIPLARTSCYGKK